MKKALVILFSLAVATGAFGQGISKDLNNDHIHKYPSNDRFPNDRAGGSGGAGNLVDHGGEVLTNAKVVDIFWGWPSNTTDQYVSEVVAFRDSAYGMINHIGMLSQYRSTGSTGFKGTQPDVYDAVPPPSTAVTDAMVEQKVATECAKLSGGCKTDTVYEVFIPAGYYSKDGSSTSCGGPNLQYCAYHGNGDGVNLSSSIKYSIQPYPSCSGCHGKSAWTSYNDEEHFIVHETREAMTDARLNAWYDNAGYEADDKCAWGQNLKFLFDETTVDGHTFAYQMEYSNSARVCVK